MFSTRIIRHYSLAFAGVWLLFQASASAALITLIGGATGNGNFESPNVTAPTQVDTVGAVIPNWSIWTQQGVDNDTGVYDAGSTGSQVLYIQGGGAVKNVTSYVVQAGDLFDFSFLHALVGRGPANISLLYQDGANFIQIPGTSFSSTTAVATISGTYTIPLGSPAIGKVIGVGLIAPAGSNYPEIDNVALSVTPIPEPTFGATCLAMAWLGWVSYRRRTAR